MIHYITVPLRSAVRICIVIVSTITAVQTGAAQGSNGLVVTPFAQAPLKNITAVHVENSGRVFAVESSRRKGGEWTLGDREKSYGFNTIAEKRLLAE